MPGEESNIRDSEMKKRKSALTENKETMEPQVWFLIIVEGCKKKKGTINNNRDLVWS